MEVSHLLCLRLCHTSPQNGMAGNHQHLLCSWIMRVRDPERAHKYRPGRPPQMAAGQRAGGIWGQLVRISHCSWLLTATTSACTRKAGSCFAATAARHLHVAARGLGLFSVAAHSAENESASIQGRYGSAFRHPAWKVSCCHCH